YKVLLNELKQYNPELLDKPRMLAVTKADIMDTGMLEELRPSLPKEVPSLFISSVSGLNIERLKDRIWALLNDQEDF
ncbi:MAG: GTPase ObgE, partial [Bacteroidales bacterium]|nr:GTPase ObgE [Bacteroidales bacterium]